MNRKRMAALAAALMLLASGCRFERLGRMGQKETKQEPSSSASSKEPAGFSLPDEVSSETDENASVRETVRLAFEAFRTLDEEQMVQYTDGAERLSGLMNEEMRETASLITKDFSFAVGEAAVNENTATVQVQATNRDFSAVITRLLPSLVIWEMQHPNPTWQETADFFLEKMPPILSETDAELITRDIVVELVRSGTSWKVRLDAAAADALLGGMLTGLGGLASQLGISLPEN